MTKIKTSWNSVNGVLSKRKYFLTSLLIAFTFFSISILSKNFKLIIELLPNTSFLEYLKLILGLYWGGLIGNVIHATIILITISVLLGITVSLMLFKINSNGKIKGNISKTGTLGAIIGVTLPTCIPCGIGILSVLGLGSILAFLPFQGTELGVLSILLLAYAIFSLGYGINTCSSCQANLNTPNIRKK